MIYAILMDIILIINNININNININNININLI